MFTTVQQTTLQPFLFDILLRNRMNYYCITGDIKKAFLQIRIHPQDRDSLRILWYEDLITKQIKEYWFTRAIFGAGPSPYILNATIRKHVGKFTSKYPETTTQPANIGPQDVPRTSSSNVPRTSPKGPIWPSRGLPNLTSRDVPIWRPGDVLKWRPEDALVWRSRDVPGGLIRDVPRTFSGRSLEDLQSTHTWMSQNFF